MPYSSHHSIIIFVDHDRCRSSDQHFLKNYRTLNVQVMTTITFYLHICREIFNVLESLWITTFRWFSTDRHPWGWTASPLLKRWKLLHILYIDHRLGNPQHNLTLLFYEFTIYLVPEVILLVLLCNRIIANVSYETYLSVSPIDGKWLLFQFINNVLVGYLP